MSKDALVEIKAPTFPESISEGTLTVWHVAVGAAVRRDDVLADIETDKVTIEIGAPDDGAMVEMIVPEEGIVTTEMVIGRFQAGVIGAIPEQSADGGGASDQTDDAADQPAAHAPADADADNEQDEEATLISPAARKVADEHSLSLARITGSGKDGRITKGDVLAAIEAGTAAPAAAAAPATTAPTPTAQPRTAAAPAELDPGARAERRVPMTRLRASIARRLVTAQQTAASLTTFNEVDMSAIMGLRKQYQDDFVAAHDGTRLGFMSFFVRASVEALKRFPAVNASIDDDDIVYHGYYDIGVAVGTERGLVVPVVRDADGLSMAQLERKVAEFGTKARDNKLTLDDMAGGTFTISNGGVFGSMLSTPILNPPQTGILGMHKIEQRPVVVDGEIVIRPMMYLALSYDHRLIDGSESVRFLVTIKELLEEPARILLDL